MANALTTYGRLMLMQGDFRAYLFALHNISDTGAVPEMSFGELVGHYAKFETRNKSRLENFGHPPYQGRD